MKKCSALLAVLFLPCCLRPCILRANDKIEPAILDMSLEQLQDIVVTDTKIVQPQDTVTQRVEVIEAADMGRQPLLHRNISELLLYRSGLFVNTLSRNDANWGSFGGLGPKYNGYLLDGLPMDAFVDAMSLDPWAFERVELYKGPASVMYSNYLTMDFAGNETPLAGITNFILKDGIEAPLTRVQLGGGSYGTARGKLYHQNRKGGLSYFLGGNYEQSHYTDYGATDSWLHILSDPEYDKGALYGKFSYMPDAGHRLSLFFHHTAHSGEVGRPNRDFDHRYDIINLTSSNQLSQALHLQVKGGYRNYDRLSGEDWFPLSLESSSHEGVRQRIFPLDLSCNLKHFDSSILTFGADAQFADYETDSEVGGVTMTNNEVASFSQGVFAQEKLVLDQWVLRAGGRFNTTRHTYDIINGAPPLDAVEKTWSRPVWSIGARYNASSALAVYTNFGTSFVVPSAKQIWGTTSDPASSGQLPNQDLEEESGMGADLGVEWRPGSRWVVGLRGFVNQIEEAIIDNVVSQIPSQTQSVNAGKARSSGVEIMSDLRVSEDLSWFANLTCTSSEVSNDSDRNNDGTDIPFVPDLLINTGLTARLPWEVSVSTYLHWVGNYYDSTQWSGRHEFGSYATVNMRIEKPLLTKPAYTVNTFIDINNMTNKRFEMPWGFRDPGFNAFIGLEMTFF